MSATTTKQATIELTGMSWDHPRGHDSVVAAAAAFATDQPDVRVTWQTRSLQDFADYPIEVLAERFDFVLIDHPFVGFAAATGCLLPIDAYLDADFLADQAANSVGASHRSYIYGPEGHQWALATDAASQVSAYRADLLERLGVEIPTTWDAVLTLAEARVDREEARVANPLIPVDTLMSFCSLCTNAGEEPFTDPEIVVSRPVGRHALETLRRLQRAAHPESTTWNPIRTFERMSATNEIAYVPLAFGYSNYARFGFREHLIDFIDVPRAADGIPRGAILGGVGLAVSAATKHPEAAIAYARYVASPEIQRGLYVEAGGQPGHRSAWTDPEANALTHGFFANTLATLDASYLRPRYLGYMEVQERAGHLLHDWLTADAGSDDACLDALDATYRGSRRD